MTSRIVVLLLWCAAATSAGAEAPAAANGTGPARTDLEMVLIHGLGGAGSEWDELRPYLDDTFRVVSFELSGHGASQPVVDPTIVSEAQRLAAFIRKESLAYPTLVGHGLGGMVALQYTLDNPSRVHRLILIDSAPRQLADAAQKAEIGRALVASYDKFVAEKYVQMSPDEAVTDRILDMALRTHAPSFVSLLMSSFDYDLTDRLRTLSVPLLVVGSELMFPTPDQCKPLLEQYGYGKARSLSFKRFGRTGHYIMLEQPVFLASVLMAFGVSADHRFEY